MSKIFPIFIALIAFIVGYVISNLKSTYENQTYSSHLEQQTSEKQTNQISENFNIPLVNSETPNISLSKINQEKLLTLLQDVPSDQLENYLKRAFPEQDLQYIKDKKQFSKRLIEELNQNKTSSKKLSGEIVFSTSASLQMDHQPLNNIHAQQFIYAHLNTFGSSPPNTQIFVKWINLDTQDVVLFTPKYIQENSQQNWVSAVPAEGWQNSQYLVTFYEMDDQLNPIAQANYTLSSVIQ
ncbi:hypothetical protein [Acinetobacter equi]|uniref:Uncharacterized protein n=1 Tax=Acinetobacter equi TaxID=1324350 RepID=A0A0N7GXQ6_9GAMM|nr:hypothetical protein [Acinetobacter equi]ALH95379.1 hypothetical protein AOY20_07415 [Acinetobacter equi]